MHKVVHILACGKSGGIETLVAEYAKKSSHNNYFVFVWEDGYYEQQIRAVSYTHLTLPTILLV